MNLPAELGGAVQTRVTLRIRTTVETVEPRSITYRSRLEELRFDVDPTPPGLPDLSGLEGNEFRHRSDRSGRLLAVEVPGVETDVASALRSQVENWLTQLGFPPLPTAPVLEGQTWTDSTRLSALEVLGVQAPWQLLELRSATLEQIVATSAGGVAVLRVRSVWRLDPGVVARGNGVPDVGGEGEEIIRFDLERGRYLGSSGASDLRFPASTGPDGEVVIATATARHATVLVDFATGSNDPPD